MIMRIPTMISGIILALTLAAQVCSLSPAARLQSELPPSACVAKSWAMRFAMQMPHYTNVASREWFVGGIGMLIVLANSVMIFFAAVHCPAHMVINGAVVANDCTQWY
jgi:hypothetical protein